MSLVRIDDEMENSFLSDNLPDTFWIGANDRSDNQSWVWSKDGAEFWNGDENGDPTGSLYSKWDPGEPNTSSNDCAVMLAGGNWEDSNCNNNLGYICEAL
ncbi:unnamed protein product [marine sediment metagenome]|uniref:C-type lectin domain-containing protein n=1 Tax=marine sediment metagenome TaxID=412755 RepID=X1BXK8_9ZZZZ